MTRKTVGYTELEWICPNCESRNPGAAKSCRSCGTAQPDNVEFVQPLYEEIISDEEEIAAAKAEPDIHCAFCGTRNSASAAVCRQCGADLSEGTARTQGKVLGAHRDQPAPPVTCPACNSENDASAQTCQNCGAALAAAETPKKTEPKEKSPKARPRSGLLIVILLAIVALCVGGIFFATRTSEKVGEVSNVRWTRAIDIQSLAPVTRETWRDDIPSGLSAGNCRRRLHHTEEEAAPGAQEVCGTPYTVDEGTGYGEVVQDCRYEIYRDWCEYETTVWQTVDQVVASGSLDQPQWPLFTLAEGQREGEREADNVVVFTSDGEIYQLSVRDGEALQDYAVGTRWKLDINSFGSVVGAEQIE